ncbi:MAG: DUF885 family protein, partial [Pseudomonadota bacterium]
MVWLAAFAGLPACAQESGGGAPRAVARESDALFDTLARMELSARPELVTLLGLQTGTLDPRENVALGDRSQAAFERLRLRRIEVLKYLESLPLAPIGTALHRDQEAVLRTYARAVAVAEFGHGWVDLGNAYPYVIDHRRGAWTDIPSLLISRQSVGTALEAADFIGRLTAMADVMEDERLRLMADGAAGIVPPEPVLVRLSEELASILETPAEAQPVIVAFEDLLTGADGLDADARLALREDALRVMERRVMPAYRRLVETVNRLFEQTNTVPGVWSFPRGDEYYDALLALHISPDISAESLHREARARVDELTQALDQELRFLGWSQGSVGARLEALARDPFQALEDTEEGRTELEALLQNRLEGTRGIEGWIAREPALPIVLDAIDGPPGFARYIPPPANRARP